MGEQTKMHHRDLMNGRRDTAHQGRDVFLSTLQAADFVGCPTRAAFRKWAKRAGIVTWKRLGRGVVSKLDCEAAMRWAAGRSRESG